MAQPASAERPYLTARMDKMAKAFEHDNYIDLMAVLYQFADEDLMASRGGINKKSLESSMGRLCRDKLKERHAFQLLLSIPPNVVKRIMKGDIALYYTGSVDFKNSLYEMNRTHGIYLYTLTVRRPEDLDYESILESTLTRLEVLQLVAMMRRYKDTRGIPGNEEAVKIDNAYKSSKTNGVDTLNEGTRVLLGGSNGKAIDSLCDTLLQRWLEVEDPDGKTLQFQSPCGVGYSKNLATQGSKPVGETLTTSTKPWVLFCSCLKVMGLDVNRISIPILKIWNDEQRELGEILITMLASSLVEDGGFNPVQAGSSNGSTGIHSYEEEDGEVFIDNGVLMDNIERTDKLVTSRKKFLSTVVPLLDGRLEYEVAGMEMAVRQLGVRVAAREAVIKDGIGQAKAQLAVLQKRLDEREEEVEFMKEFNAWMALSES